MMHFFRRLRNQVLGQSRFGRYLLYATGEVVLVVVGILIALQIDTWNEERKDRRAEQDIIENLRQEFLANQTELDSNKNALFSEIAYESPVDDYLYRLMRYENNLKKGRALMQKILRIIENDP